MTPTDLPNAKLIERIRSRCVEDKLSGCWVYGLSVNSAQYANTIRHALDLGGASEMIQSSRLAWSALKGEIPEGFEVDHLCKNKKCLNPHHLEVVSPTVNRGRNRVAEPHPLTAWWFPSPDIAAPTYSSTVYVFGST